MWKHSKEYDEYMKSDKWAAKRQERANIRERQAQGLAQMPINPKTGKQRSLKTGRDIGRPTAEYPYNWKEVYTEWKAKKITAVEAMKQTGLKKNTFYNLR